MIATIQVQMLPHNSGFYHLCMTSRCIIVTYVSKEQGVTNTWVLQWFCSQMLFIHKKKHKHKNWKKTWLFIVLFCLCKSVRKIALDDTYCNAKCKHCFVMQSLQNPALCFMVLTATECLSFWLNTSFRRKLLYEYQ
jgi:hypothetical protein